LTDSPSGGPVFTPTTISISRKRHPSLCPASRLTRGLITAPRIRMFTSPRISGRASECGACPGGFAPSKNIHHPSATLRPGSDTEDTEFWFPSSLLRDLGASVVNFHRHGWAAGQCNTRFLRKSARPDVERRPWSATGRLYFATSHGRFARPHKPPVVGAS